MKRIVWPVLLALLFLAGLDSYAQTPMERVYATSQFSGGLGIVVNPGSAVDTDLTSYSKLTLALLGSVYQQLVFPESIPAGTPIRIKVGTDDNLLGLLGNMRVQAYQGGSAVGNSVPLSTLISLLAGEDQNEIVFIPMNGTTPVTYNAVRITYSGVALAGGFRIYEAYYYKPTTTNITCDQPLDVLSGSTGPIAGSLNGVENAYNSIDGNQSTFATIKANVSALNTTHITALYPVASSPGDSIHLVIRNPAGLLDLTLLASNFTVKTYLDTQDNGELDLDPSLLRLRLLPGATDIQVLTYPVTHPFNRLEVSLGSGLVNALGALEVYEISRLAVGPTVNETNEQDRYFTCKGIPVEFTIQSPISGYIYRWYSDNGNLLTSGISFNAGTLPAGEHIYYVSSVRSGCTTESGRTMVVVQVTEAAVPGDITVSDAVECEGLPVELTPTSLLSNPVYTWYKDVKKAQPITNGTEGLVSYSIDENGVLTITGLPGGSDITYYVAVTSDEKCENAAGDLTSANVKITTAALADDITIEDEVICEGASAVLRPSSGLISPEYRWYRNADRTGEILDGTSDGLINYELDSDGTLTVTNLPAEDTYTYYLSVQGTDKCENLADNLKEVKVVVEHPPEQPDITLLD